MSGTTEEEGYEAGTEPVRSRRRRGRFASVLAVGGSVLVLTLAGLWLERAPLAENLIAQELAARGVRMTYRIASIGLRTQRIENIVLGDPARPALTARGIVGDIAFTGFTPGIANVRAGGLRLRGALHDGRLSLGELDKFMGHGKSAETVLPDIGLHLEDARASLVTDYGPVGLVMDGDGNLHDGFAGRAVVAMPQGRFAGCGVQKMHADLAISMTGGAPRFIGPLTAQALGCLAQALALAAPRIDVDARLDRQLALAQANAHLLAEAARGEGMTLVKPAASLSISHDGKGYEGSGRIAAHALGGRGLAAGESTLDGRFTLGEGGAGLIGGKGQATLANIGPSRGVSLAGLAAAAAGTPLAPLADKLARAVQDAARSNRLSADFAVDGTKTAGTARLTALRFVSTSGARLALSNGSRLAMGWPSGSPVMDGTLAMGGGGLPEGKLDLKATVNGGLTGALQMKPYSAGTARLALTPVTFRAAPDGSSRFATLATLDGPLADGGVSGLSLPLAGAFDRAGNFALNAQCAPLRWRRLAVSGLQLDPASVTLCPDGGAVLRSTARGLSGGMHAPALALAGRIGSSPLSLQSGAVSADLGKRGFAAHGLSVRIGKPDAPVLLSADRLDGAMNAGGFGGSFADGKGRIGTVPFDLSQMAGRWRFARGKLDVDGAMQVADTAASARFMSLSASDVHLALADGRITATGHLRHPVHGGDFVRVEIVHDLASGTGDARFALETLRFGTVLQPNDLTPLALGVVANVEGGVEGSGAVHWTPQAVTSTGRFTTTDMKLAAAFGPVEGLSTTLNFTDLIAMQTAPGQVATLRSVNPGIEARDGRVVFQLLPEQRARIEGGEWPFAGGRLTLLPSTLDFDVKRERHLVFRVTGLDAGAFIQTLDLEDISATGTYDGLLPMIFDANGGRIEGGILVARQEGLPPLVVEDAHKLSMSCDQGRQGGTLSYVGQVSNAQLGTYGKMAFDALKHLRYKCLTILLDGALDGEFVTQLAINGVNQGSEEASQSMIVRPFLGLPFLFNVRVQAPFRGLLNTYQSFVDPSSLIRNSLGPQYQSVLNNGVAVQPADSDKGAKKEGE